MSRSVGAIFAALAVTCLALSPAVAAGSAPPVTWNNVTLGQPVSKLRLTIGDPLRIIPFDGGKARVARYWIPGANSTYFLVMEERGYVTGFDVFTDTPPAGILANVTPDPSGVQLGETLETVKAKHPSFKSGVDNDGNPLLAGKISESAGAEYSFEDGRAFRTHWVIKLDPNLPELAQLTLPAGDSFATAIADVQQSETDGVAWEYRYLAFHPCAENARWQLNTQALLQNGGRAYDRLSVLCPATKAERDYYFDISRYFGKV